MNKDYGRSEIPDVSHDTSPTGKAVEGVGEGVPSLVWKPIRAVAVTGMDSAGRRALVDLSDVELPEADPADGSVLDWALRRVRRERDRTGPIYCAFTNTPAVPWPDGPGPHTRKDGTR